MGWRRAGARGSGAWVVGLALLLVVLVGGLPPAGAQSGRSEIVSVVVDAVVEPDGDMRVTERLAFDFEGERNGGFRTFVPSPGHRIEGFTVTEGDDPRDLAPGFDDPNGGEPVRWFGSAAHTPVSGRHDYVLAYTVAGAVDVHPDAAELYWQFVGTDFPSLESVVVEVALPGGGADVRAFAHGTLHGVIEAEGDRVRLAVVGNPAGQFVEARIVMAPEAFAVEPSGPPALDAILEEEALLAVEANEAREAARFGVQFHFNDSVRRAADAVAEGCTPPADALGDDCDELAELLERARRQDPERLDVDDLALLTPLRALTTRVVGETRRAQSEEDERRGGQVGVGVGLAALVAFAVVHRRWGREPRPPADIGDYWREVPIEPPAIVAAIDRWGKVDGPTVFAVTVVDLAQRGLLSIGLEQGGHRFTITEAAEGQELYGYEVDVLHRLFAHGRATVTRSGLMAEARTDPTGASRWMEGLRSKALEHYRSLGHQSTSRLPFAVHAVVIAATLAAAAFALVNGSLVGAAVAAVVAVGLAVGTRLLRRRTAIGSRRHAELEAFKRFLRDFSQVDDVPLGHLALYERYLVYAIALGVAEDLLRGLRLRFPDLVDPGSGFATWYGPVRNDDLVAAAAVATVSAEPVDRFVGGLSLASFGGSFERAAAVAFSPPARAGGVGSGSGRDRYGGGGFDSGGFSGGGGGGGGGGGAGSW